METTNQISQTEYQRLRLAALQNAEVEGIEKGSIWDDIISNELLRIYGFEKIMGRKILYATELEGFEYCVSKDPNFKQGDN